MRTFVVYSFSNYGETFHLEDVLQTTDETISCDQVKDMYNHVVIVEMIVPVIISIKLVPTLVKEY